ncbi:hypothetical protein BS47DRAFT_742640 [Hydnum rufescens UP504]|uniref:Uncharacterized protein n=1 Tax=Hydnum rufescens UP504 TaxID=1448309 RepID=A0A9P6B3Q1_9AGAM|nr:hypothetical protein BS47DRAFT_742640 [Hydnum rufescens UP504]
MSANVHVALKWSSPRPSTHRPRAMRLLSLTRSAISPNPNHPVRAHLVQFLNSFELKPDDGIPGSSTIHVTDYRHVCMIFEPLWGNVLTLRCLHWCDETNLKRVSLLCSSSKSHVKCDKYSSSYIKTASSYTWTSSRRTSRLSWTTSRNLSVKITQSESWL